MAFCNANANACKKTVTNTYPAKNYFSNFSCKIFELKYKKKREFVQMEPVELNETTPKRKRYLRSKWWKYFTHEEIANKITIICNNECSFTKTYDKNDFRTNYLQDNIKDKHKVIFADMNSAKEIRVFSEEEINRIQVDTVMWIINDNRPL